MKILMTLALVFLTLSFFTAVYADVPPDAGYKRITQKLVIEPKDDFTDYRFFIKVGADLKEYVLKKDQLTTIESMGGGAWYRNGKFLAVPKKALFGLSETATDQRLNPLQQAIYDDKVAGTIVLVEHGFIRDVPTAEAAGAKDPVYRLEKDTEKGIKATPVTGSQNSNKAGNTQGSYYSTEPKTPEFWATVVGGILLTLAFICLGVFAIRRSKMKSIGFDATTK
ncbi:MAG: hypothetical protein WBC19_02855 [Pyrinomonadaceae bacterium]